MIEFENVTKLYGTVIGVNDISLSLPPGAYGLVGPNGSGKSTLLNMITGQLSPTIGRVRIFGESPIQNARLYRRLGYCPSSEGLYSDVSAIHWVTYLQELGGMSQAQARDAAHDALVQTGLKDVMQRPISTYSRGMRQRVKLAQAIAHNPDLLILDEPFSGLDPIGRNQMTMLLKTWLQAGKSLLLATHVLHEIESLTPAFLLMCGGRLLAAGNSNDVHGLLADVPNRITLCSSTPRPLAALLLEQDLGDAFAIHPDRIVVETQNPGRLFALLPELLKTSDCDVTELHSEDESLNALFSSLMKIHRGER
jgi:ABC-2 type transport system ATP-binding protein